MIIAVSKLSANYANWLNHLGEELTILDLKGYKVNDLFGNIQSFSGILLSGGGDIHPKFYGKEEEVPLCKGIDLKRDEMELQLIDLAFQENIPLLGICRGQQILNVTFKGSLHADISASGVSSAGHFNDKDVFHPVTVVRDSLLSRITKVTTGIVNSSHHQAVAGLAEGFSVSAFSDDGIIEAIEYTGPKNHGFCLAVQWHPERMAIESPLSGILGRKFIEEAKKRSRE
jgi:putative glutamine amidotransferase